MTPEIKRRLAVIASRWDEVEERMKTVELLRGETLSAAINELRYTGRKIADVLNIIASSDESQATFDAMNEQLIVAENYLNNADHDVTDAAVLFVGVRVKRVVERHRKKKVIRCVPKFDELHKSLEEAHKIVAESRGKRGQRAEIYRQLSKTQIPVLIELYRQLSSHPDLGLPEEGRRLTLISVMAILGATAAVANFTFNALAWYFAPDPPTLKQIEETVRAVVTAPR
jgi:hypothetical protein